MKRPMHRPMVAALGLLPFVMGVSCHDQFTGYDDQKLIVYVEHAPIKTKDSVAVFAYLTLATGDLILVPIDVTFRVSGGLLKPGVPVLQVRTDTTGLARVLLYSPDSAGSVVLRVQARDAVVSDTIEVVKP